METRIASEALTDALGVILRFRRAGLRILPGMGHNAILRGSASPGRKQFTQENLPDLRRHWRDVVAVLRSVAAAQ
jgi:hypothetical protein